MEKNVAGKPFSWHFLLFQYNRTNLDYSRAELATMRPPTHFCIEGLDFTEKDAIKLIILEIYKSVGKFHE